MHEHSLSASPSACIPSRSLTLWSFLAVSPLLRQPSYIITRHVVSQTYFDVVDDDGTDVCCTAQRRRQCNNQSSCAQHRCVISSFPLGCADAGVFVAREGASHRAGASLAPCLGLVSAKLPTLAVGPAARRIISAPSRPSTRAIALRLLIPRGASWHRVSLRRLAQPGGVPNFERGSCPSCPVRRC